MAYEMKSKYTHEWHRYYSVRNDFGVDRLLRVRAIDRYQYHRKPNHINALRGYVLIRKY